MISAMRRNCETGACQLMYEKIAVYPRRKKFRIKVNINLFKELLSFLKSKVREGLYP